MRCKTPNTILLALLLVAASSGMHAMGQTDSSQQETQDPGIVTRGAFFSTRPGGTKKPASTSTSSTTDRNRRPTPSPNTAASRLPTPAKAKTDKNKTGGNKSNASKNSGTNRDTTTTTTTPDVNNTTTTPVASTLPDGSMAVPDAAAIGLGYTLYMRDANGDAVRVDPAREFSEGDRIRVLLEANTDGYLYIFHTEDGNSPQMLYPDAKLEGGRNDIRAHVPYQVPGALIGWFKFDQRPAIERLYVVITREPLSGVPNAAALVKHCEATPGACPFRPTSGMWAQIKSEANAPVVISQSKDEGQKLTADENQAVTRGLGLSLDAPPPTIIRMNASSNTNKMVTTIDLVHK